MSGGVWHRTLVYLGLKDEPDEGYDDLPERFPTEDVSVRRTTISRGDRDDGRYRDDIAPVRSLHADEAQPRTGDGPPAASQAQSAAQAPPTSLRTPVIEILVFDDVEAVGARYRTGQTVLFDVSKADQKIGRRVIDFVSGLTYVSRGRLRKVGDRAFLLVPEGVELPDSERLRLADMGYEVAVGGSE
ncbi:MAG: cell division protein SepF [Nitriliruptoraceae bacterium]